MRDDEDVLPHVLYILDCFMVFKIRVYDMNVSYLKNYLDLCPTRKFSLILNKLRNVQNAIVKWIL